MDEMTVARMARQMINDSELPTGWTFRFNNNTSRVGVCKYRSKSIEVSRVFLPRMPEAMVRNTLTHELAHALLGPGYGHGLTWQRLHRSLGGDGKVCQNVGLAPTDYKWIVKCAVTKAELGRVNRKGHRLAASVCKCHSTKPLWVALR